MDIQNDLNCKLDALLAHVRYILVTGLTVTALCFSVLIHKVDFRYLFSWSIVTTLVLMCRFLISKLDYAKQKQHSVAFIYKAYAFFSISNGICWGVVTGLFLQHQDIHTTLLIFLIATFECTIAITTLAASTTLMSVYLVVVIAPSALIIFKLPEPYPYLLSIGLLLIFWASAASKINANLLNNNIITRKEAEKKAAAAESIKQRLLLSLDSTPLAYIEFSTNFMVTQWNQAATNIFGYIADDVIGHRIELFQHDKRKLHTSEENYMMLFAKASNRYHPVISTNRRFDGSSVNCEWHCAKLCNEQNEHTGYAAYVQDISKRLEQEALIKQHASFDELTGLPNKNLLYNRMSQAMSSAKRHGHLCGLLFINIDNFNQVNDALGHEFGDAALKQMAQRFRKRLRSEETLSRFVGDEFVVLIENLQSERSAAELAISVIAEKIIDAALTPLTLHHTEFTFGASIGVTLFPSEKNATPESVLRQADLALREVKNATKGRFGFYDDELNHTTLKRVKLLSGIRGAINSEQFELYVQPKLSIEDNKIVGGEALIRWHHPQKGMLSPGLFIPAIESSSYIFEFGEWVLQQALEMVSKWRAEGLCNKEFHLAVNISPRQLLDDRFAKLVNQLLLEYKLPGSCIEFEITETVLVKNFSKVNQTLKSIRAQGAQIAIDDFGTGYSSLSYLSQLPISVIKIDRSFIANIANNNAGVESIVKAILSMGRDLNLKVVAEGIENDAQLNYLKKLNCDYYQGFIFSPAIPESQFRRFLKSMEKAD